jgi:hypothetical protein
MASQKKCCFCECKDITALEKDSEIHSRIEKLELADNDKIYMKNITRILCGKDCISHLEIAHKLFLIPFMKEIIPEVFDYKGYPEEDVRLVAYHSNHPLHKALEAMVKCNGDIVDAIMELTF